MLFCFLILRCHQATFDRPLQFRGERNKVAIEIMESILHCDRAGTSPSISTVLTRFPRTARVGRTAEGLEPSVCQPLRLTCFVRQKSNGRHFPCPLSCESPWPVVCRECAYSATPAKLLTGQSINDLGTIKRSSCLRLRRFGEREAPRRSRAGGDDGNRLSWSCVLGRKSKSVPPRPFLPATAAFRPPKLVHEPVSAGSPRSLIPFVPTSQPRSAPWHSGPPARCSPPPPRSP